MGGTCDGPGARGRRLPIGPAAELDSAEWRTVLDINATGSFLVCQQFGRRVLAAGVPASVVLLTSIAYARGDAAEPAAHYAASKGAVVSLTRQLAVEWGKAGIRVNAVAPGVIATPMLRLTEDARPAQRVPTRRCAARPTGTATRSRLYACVLLGNDAAYVSGAVLPVDGGAGAA